MNFPITSSIFAFVFPSLIGYLFLRWFRLPLTLLEVLSLSFSTGFGILTLVMLLILACHLPLTFVQIVYPISICFGCLLVFQIFAKKSLPFYGVENNNLLKTFKSLHWIERIITTVSILYICFQIFFIFKITFLAPILTWDGILSIASKAKCFYYGGGLEGLANFKGSSSYPLLTELSLTWMSLTLGSWDDQWIKLIFPVTSINFLLMQYCFMKRYLDPWRAILSCALTLSSYFLVYHSTIEYRAIIFMYYNLIPIFLIWISFQKKDSTLLIIAGLTAGFSAFVKLEGTGHLLLYLFLILFLMVTEKRSTPQANLMKLVQFFTPAFLVNVPFWMIKHSYHLGGFEGRLDLVFQDWTQRLIPILNALNFNLFMSPNWSLLWIFLLIFVAANPAQLFKNPTARFLGLTLILYLSLYIVLGLFTSTYVSLFIYKKLNLSRAILHFFPLCPMLLTFLIKKPPTTSLDDQ